MATRGRIGYRDSEGEIRFIYNHYDSYFDGLGEELLKNYNSPDLALMLICEGDCRFPGDPFSDIDDWEDVKPQITEDLNDLRDEDYAYVWMDNEWWTARGRRGHWVNLSRVMERG